VVVHALQKADEREVIDQRLGCGDDLDEVWVEGLDAGEDSIKVVRSGEVVVADEEADAGVAQLLQVALLEALGGFKFEIHQVEPGSSAFCEDFQFGGEGPRELATIATRRQVAIAVAAVLSAKNCLNLGSASSGFSR